MGAQFDLQRLLQRQGEIQRAMRRPGGIRITVERELQRIREQLKNFPDCAENAAAAIGRTPAATARATRGRDN
jgi:hypothetical protein